MRNIPTTTDKAEGRRYSEVLAACVPTDFDGHTHFQYLTPSQRLDALASLARLVFEWKGKAAESGDCK
jgi:hypothetical protein